MKIFTSESVCSGHPDKICDQISDSILDAALKIDPASRVAVETMVGTNRCVIMGEVTTKAKLNYEQVARKMIRKLGYDSDELGFSFHSPVEVRIHEQSVEIAEGVDDKGAGDQGMMYGYASNETSELMPMPIAIAHRLARRIDEVREKSILTYLKPDGKTQISIAYENGKPKKVTGIVVAVPHKKQVGLSRVKKDIYKNIVVPVLEKYKIPYKDSLYVVNGTGVWHNGGPASDTGLTGRKIVVDTYGGIGRIGGGAFSGKDPTKVDRSGAYAARYLAKNIVAHGLADKAEVRLAYFIGAKKPVMQEFETFGTEKVSERTIADFLASLLDTSVSGIINTFKLRRPIYAKTAAYGHFGRPGLPWENIN